jgi:cobalamin-dependent methionine synthase I
MFLVVTIGIGLEARVSELFAEGKTVEAFVLDAVGSAAAMNGFTQVLTRILEETKSRGWYAGTCLRPGQNYWDITGQETIFQMVPAEKIGVELLESSFMKPQKSQSGVVPLGPNLKVHGDPTESYCRYCQATRCPMRREPQAGQLA